MSEKIQVALCITELNRGGAEKIFCELARSLDAGRFETVVYCLRSIAYHNDVNFIPFLEKHGIKVVFLNMTGPISVWRGIRRLARLLREQRADIFQSFMFHANLFGRLAARRAGVRVVCSGLRVSEKERKYHLWLDRLTARKVDAWVAVSRSVAEFSEKVGKLPKNRLFVIENSVTNNNNDTIAIFNNENKPLLPLFDDISGKKAVVIGRLTYQKGIDWLLSTAPEWLNGSKSADWGLWIIGTGDSEAELKRLAAALPNETAERVHFAGWRPDITDILADADLLLLPSRWEGMPNALLEGAAAGRAALATATDGVVEILGEDLAGPQTVRFGDDAGWLDKITPLLADDALRERLGEANRRRVTDLFSLEKMVSRYEMLWTRLLEEKSAARRNG